MSRFIGASKNRGGAGTPDKSANTSGLLLTNDGQNDGWGGGVDFISANTVLGQFNANSAAVNTNITVVAAVAPLGGTITYANTTALPGNLTLNSNTGAITGSNTGLTSNSYTFDIRATESKYGGFVTKTFSIVVDQTNGFPIWTTAAAVSNTAAFAGANAQITFAATGINSRVYSIANTGTLPGTSSINSSSGVLTLNTAVEESATSSTTRTYTFTLRATDSVSGKFADRTFTASTSPFTIQPGQAIFAGAYNRASGSTDTYTWVAPMGVTTVSAFMMGGGGGGSYQWANCGGSGGASIWGRNLPVTPGTSYTIRVGSGGCWDGGQGGCSCFAPLGIAYGGSCGCCNYFPGTPFVYNGTGTAGTDWCGGFGMVAYNGTAGGGGGGAGYTTGCCAAITPGYNGIGGGGGSASAIHSSTYGSGGGGGTGACGEGTSGGCGNPSCSPTTGTGGRGGSGGTNGNPGEPFSNGQGNGYGCGGTYGGGGGGGGTSHGGGWGGPGVVRIIWGAGRSYPSTGTTSV